MKIKSPKFVAALRIKIKIKKNYYTLCQTGRIHYAEHMPALAFQRTENFHSINYTPLFL